MSYDICVFNRKRAPIHKNDFLKWYERIMEWNGDSGFDDISVASKELQEWYSFMLKHYPAMNGRDAEESQQCYAKAKGVDVDAAIDDSADYSIDNNLIYVAFGYSQAKDAYKLAIGKAKELGLGIFDPQEGSFPLNDGYEQTDSTDDNSDQITAAPKNYEKKKRRLKAGMRLSLIMLCIAFIVCGIVNPEETIFLYITDPVKSKLLRLAFASAFVIPLMYFVFAGKKLDDIKKDEANAVSMLITSQISKESIKNEASEKLYAEIKRVLGPDCEVMPIKDGVCVNELTDIYFAERERCKKSGMFPVILQLDCNLIGDLEINLKENRGETSDAEEELENLKGILHSCFNSQNDWEEFVGNKNDEGRGYLDGIDRVDFMWGRFAVVRLPIANASDVFSRIPVGDWSECPSPMVHRTIAQHWNERYGAVPCFISFDTIMYYVPKPVDKDSAYGLALEHAAYCFEDFFASGDTLMGMANQLEHSTFWQFIWNE